MPQAPKYKLFSRGRWLFRARGGHAPRRLALLTLGALALLGLAEVAGRALGLHTPVLYEKTAYGYRPAPNQAFTRLGRAVRYDHLGLRSPAPAGGRRVLFLGDSVLNGGVLIDQAATIPYLVSALLAREQQAIEVMNASAPGWALANQAGWLHRHGTGGARAVVLVMNTFDLFQEAASADMIGVHPAFPEQPPRFALVEVLKRYLIPKLLGTVDAKDPGAEMDTVSLETTTRALTDLRWIVLRARGEGAMVYLVVVHPTVPLSASAAALTHEAKRLLRASTDSLRLPVIDTLEAMRQAGGQRLFRDGLHPTVEGNRVIAREIAARLTRADDR